MAGLLVGVKVIESGFLDAAPFAGQLLADEGAEVIKLEAPSRGDYLRDFPQQFKPHAKGHCPQYVGLNRNKRSVTVNLKSEVGKSIFRRMLEDTDVFIDGMMPGMMDSLGAGYQDQKRTKPEIIYAQVTGFGATGPYSRLPLHGFHLDSLAGTKPCRVGDDGLAQRAGDGIGSRGGAAMGVVVGPLYLAYAVAAALFRRGRTGQGAYIDVACSDAVIAHCSWIGVIYELNKEKIANYRGGTGETDHLIRARHSYYYTGDGRFLFFAPIERHFWEIFCRSVDRADLIDRVDVDDSSHRQELQRIIGAKTLQEWMDLALREGLPIGPANAPEDLVADPQLSEREALIVEHHPGAGDIVVAGNPIKVEGERFEVHRHSPALGEHTRSYLRGLGYSDEQTSEWRRLGYI